MRVFYLFRRRCSNLWEQLRLVASFWSQTVYFNIGYDIGLFIYFHIVFGSKEFLFESGMFPNHIPNPEDKTAMRAITKAVLDNKADLGIIFDTDVDR